MRAVEFGEASMQGSATRVSAPMVLRARERLRAALLWPSPKAAVRIRILGFSGMGGFPGIV